MLHHYILTLISRQLDTKIFYLTQPEKHETKQRSWSK